MSDIGLELELTPGSLCDAEDRDGWPVGHAIRGDFRIDNRAARPMRGIGIELAWKTSGRGTSNGATVDRVAWKGCDLPALARFELPFELHIPESGPITHAGHLISIDWTVTATIDIPWGIDVAESQPITVLPRLVHREGQG